jgi:L-aminopeptidase/D-esterase-like protein
MSWFRHVISNRRFALYAVSMFACMTGKSACKSAAPITQSTTLNTCNAAFVPQAQGAVGDGTGLMKGHP